MRLSKGVNSQKQDALDYWQTKLFKRLLFIIGYFGLPLLPLGAIFFIKGGDYLYGLIEIFFAVVILFVIKTEKISIDLKKIFIIILMYLVSVMVLLLTGVIGAGFVSIVLTLVLAGCILERKQLIYFSIVNIAVFSIISILLHLDLLVSFQIITYKPTWLINLLVTQFSGLGLAYIIQTINTGLESQANQIAASRDAYESVVERQFDMVRNISDVIAIISKDKIIKYISPNIFKLFGWQENQLIEHSLSFFVHEKEADLYDKMLLNLLKNTQPVTIEIKFLTAEKGYVDIQLTAINLLDNQNIEGILINFHDVSLMKNANRELQRVKEIAEVANEAKNNFLSSMSHELRTPLNGILGAMQLMELTSIDEEQNDYIQISKKSAEDLEVIVGDILDYANLESSSTVLNKSQFKVSILVNELYKMYMEKAHENNLEFNIIISDHIPKYLNGDYHKIRRVLTHLIDNAIKFTKDGHVTLEISLFKETSSILWQVKDTGIGIDVDKFNMIFNRFSQVESTSNKSYGGSGLGLSICKQLVELMEGEISVKSTLNRGSEFTVTLDNMF